MGGGASVVVDTDQALGEQALPQAASAPGGVSEDAKQQRGEQQQRLRPKRSEIVGMGGPRIRSAAGSVRGKDHERLSILHLPRVMSKLVLELAGQRRGKAAAKMLFWLIPAFAIACFPDCEGSEHFQ